MVKFSIKSIYNQLIKNILEQNFYSSFFLYTAYVINTIKTSNLIHHSIVCMYVRILCDANRQHHTHTIMVGRARMKY